MENLMEALEDIRGGSGMFCGQAFTQYTCKACGATEWHHNTNTPMLCKECAKKIFEEYFGNIMARDVDTLFGALKPFAVKNELARYKSACKYHKLKGWEEPSLPSILIGVKL